MENPKKRRGISLTRFAPKQPAYTTPSFAKSNVCLVTSNAYSSNQPHNNLSIPCHYRYSSAPKPHISFSYIDSGYSTIQKQAKLLHVSRTERPLYVTTPTKNQARIGQVWLQQQKTVKQSAFAGKYGHFDECKNTIQKRLFAEQTCKHPHLRGIKVESAIEPAQNKSLERSNQQFYSKISYNEVISRRRQKLQIQKDVVSYKLNELSQSNIVSEMKGKQLVDSVLKSPKRSRIFSVDVTKMRSDVRQQKSSAANLQNLKQMQKKLKQIIQICDQTVK